jgi:hypothetical protein
MMAFAGFIFPLSGLQLRAGFSDFFQWRAAF